MIPFSGQTKDLATGTTPVPKTCPLCGRKTNPVNGCRKVRLGYWCQRGQLAEDASAWLLPEPDPKHVAARNDPKLLAAQAAETEAQTRFGLADEAWAVKAAELQAVRRQAQGDLGQFDARGGSWRPSAKVRQLAARERALVPEVERLWKLREVEGEALTQVRINVSRESEAARVRNGLPGDPYGNRPTPGRFEIPGDIN